MIRRPPPHWGVLNPQGEPLFQLNPDTVISIYAQGCCQNVTTPFSASGNIVHFDQTTAHFTLPRDNAQFFTNLRRRSISRCRPRGVRDGRAFT